MLVLIRGGGDLASGVAVRLHRIGLKVVILEIAQPLAVRRLVSFAESIYTGEITVEGVTAKRVYNIENGLEVLSQDLIPVLIDPQAKSLDFYHPAVMVDGRMIKRPSELDLNAASFVIGLGPGFVAGRDCHAVIETNRGHRLGRVIWHGQAEADTKVPDTVGEKREERVLRAPMTGILDNLVDIADHLEPGQPIFKVRNITVTAPFRGVLRGLVHPGITVQLGQKVGDLDPRDDPSFCTLVSDKSLAIGGGVLEAILSRPELRPVLWD
jgi:xanthine dehydrogenase accessory factor